MIEIDDLRDIYNDVKDFREPYYNSERGFEKEMFERLEKVEIKILRLIERMVCKK